MSKHGKSDPAIPEKGIYTDAAGAGGPEICRGKGLRDANLELYNDFEEMAVFGIDKEGKKAEATMPFSQLERWMKA